ncbi:MAG: ABC-2 transporter permease [Pirellulaceae bacterium]|nr:ABC-2 transporter permease [Pirellulaceae bacterium]
MNTQAIRILFLKDLFLSRRQLFGYFAAGMAASAIACIPDSTSSFIGFILVITVAIASGIHLIGTLLLAETTDQTRMFVMSLPVSLLEYSISKISVVLTTYLIPWTAMFAFLIIATFVMGKPGNVAVLPTIFFFLFGTFTLQLVTAVISESVGFTISVMVGCNVLLNVFMLKLFAIPEISAASKSDVLTWPSIAIQILAVELLIIVLALAMAFLFQSRKRDLV